MARQKKPFDAVQFTRESAERIAGVVRAAETAAPSASPLTFDRRFPERIPKMVRAATFTGSWAIGDSKTVTFKYAPTATQAVTNLSWPITHNHTVAENCIVGKEGTSWWLVVPVLERRTAVFVTQTIGQSIVYAVTPLTANLTYLSNVNVTASLNTQSCAITVGVTKSEATATAIVGIVTGITTSKVILTSETSTYLRLRAP